MPNYTPKSDDELAKEGLFPVGEYDFEVDEATEGKSKKGNEMGILKLAVFDKAGNRMSVYDYIVFGTNFGEKKFKDAAFACGLGAEYEAGKLTIGKFAGKHGKLDLDQADGSDGYPPKNTVKKYIRREQQSAVTASPKDLDQEIPF